MRRARVAFILDRAVAAAVRILRNLLHAPGGLPERRNSGSRGRLDALIET